MLLFAILLSSGCGGRQIGNGNMGETTEISTEEETVENTTNISTGQEDTVKDTSALKLLLNDEEINVRWEDNEAVQALYELAAKESVTISMSMYGGFEQVGSIGTNLPANDEQMTTVPGDIVLYSGNQIVVFYGSNTWPYTKLGHITEKSEQELAELLNNGNVTIRIEAAMESATDNSRVNSFDFE